MTGTESLLDHTRKLLRRSGLRARKRLGQHFLINEEVLRLILSTTRLMPDDTVVEVGPGPGVLTAKLCEYAGNVIAVEVDDKLASVLRDSLSSCGNLKIINKDILKIKPEEILREVGVTPARGYRVVANLPYYITSPVLRHFLEDELKPDLMVVMVQKEVAEEVTAKSGKMSLLSVGIQLYGRPEIAGYVPAACFYPEPEVDSAIMKIMPYEKPPVEISDTREFFSLVRAGFSSSRKQLANSLSQGLGIPKPEGLRLLERAGIDFRRRAETLTLEEWALLLKKYEETKLT